LPFSLVRALTNSLVEILWRELNTKAVLSFYCDQNQSVLFDLDSLISGGFGTCLFP
jgi:hypothetical protein